MSRSDDIRESRAKPETPAVTRPPGTRVVIGDTSAEFYLARIAELEEEVRTLKAALAKREASASAVIAERPGPSPSPVTADGTQGMRRGVSESLSRQADETGTDE